MNKKELREHYLEKRLALTETEYSELNQRLCSTFFSALNLSSLKVIHIFLPIQRKKEPNTLLILQRIQNEFPKIKIVIPKIDSESNTISNYCFEGFENLKKNNWDILEPVDGKFCKPEAIDIVLVPLLIADEAGHRVGYGKGFYDKFLSSCKPSCIKIGLSLFNAIDKIDDVESHDKKLDMLITPSQVLNF